MKNLLLSLLSESSDLSMMRAMSLICVVAALVVAIAGLYSNKDLGQVALLVSAFLVPAFGGKVIQAYSEK